MNGFSCMFRCPTGGKLLIPSVRYDTMYTVISFIRVLCAESLRWQLLLAIFRFRGLCLNNILQRLSHVLLMSVRHATCKSTQRQLCY